MAGYEDFLKYANRSGAQMADDILSAGKDSENYDRFGLPKNPDPETGLSLDPVAKAVYPEGVDPGLVPPAAPEPLPEDPILGPNGPSLFSRVSSAMQPLAKEVAGAGSKGAGGKANRSPALDGPAPVDALQTSMAAPMDPYGKELGDSALKSAQAEKNEVMRRTLMGRAGSEIGAGIAGLGSTVPIKVDNNIYDKIDEAAAQGEKDIVTRRKGKADELDQQKKVFELATEKEKSDPNSQVSKLGQSIVDRMSKSLGMKFNTAGVSLASLEKAFGPLERYAGIVEAGKTREAIAEQNRLTKKGTEDIKADERNSKHMQEAISDLESSRGNNPEVRQAYIDRYNANKVLGLAKLYGDPNHLSKDMVALLQQEVAKIAKGGVPTHEEFKALQNPTIMSKLAPMISTFTNKPTPANAAAFIKQYTDYTSLLRNEADKLIKDKIGRVIDLKRKSVGEEGYKLLKSKYLDEGSTPAEQSAPASGHPQDGAALEWAKNNPSDPRAKQILQANGQ